MIDLDTLERIAASKELVNIAFLFFIFVLAGAVWKLWRRIEQLHGAIARLLEARNSAQEALMREMYERHHLEDKEGIGPAQAAEAAPGDQPDAN